MARRTLPLVVIAAAQLLAAACGSQPVAPTDCRPTAPVHQGSLLVLVAEPSESSLRVVLPGPADPSAGVPYTVRWLVDARKASDTLRFQAAREGTSQLYRQELRSSGTSGQLAEFQGEVTFPARGCWDADVLTGTALGSLTFRVS